MRKNYVFLFSILFAGIMFSQTVTITKVIETPCTSPFIKTVELAVEGTVNFAVDDIQLRYSSNGAGFDPSGDNSAPTLIDISGLGVQSNTYVYIIRDLGFMQTDFPSSGITASNSITVTTATNGDDAYQLTRADGTVLSQFGADSIDGTGENWEHIDTFFSRKTGNTNSGWDINDWDSQPLNYLDGKGLCDRAASQDPLGPGSSAYENFITLGSWKVLGVDNKSLIKLSVIPNPSDKGFVTINSQNIGVKSIELYDVSGRNVLKTKLNSDILDVSSLKNGLYLLKVSIKERSSIVKLMIN